MKRLLIIAGLLHVAVVLVALIYGLATMDVEKRIIMAPGSALVSKP